MVCYFFQGDDGGPPKDDIPDDLDDGTEGASMPESDVEDPAEFEREKDDDKEGNGKNALLCSSL